MEDRYREHCQGAGYVTALGAPKVIALGAPKVTALGAPKVIASGEKGPIPAIFWLSRPMGFYLNGMANRRTDMHRLQELVRLHRMGVGAREIARILGISPNTERSYRRAIDAEALLAGPTDVLPALDVLRDRASSPTTRAASGPRAIVGGGLAATYRSAGDEGAYGTPDLRSTPARGRCVRWQLLGGEASVPANHHRAGCPL